MAVMEGGRAAQGHACCGRKVAHARLRAPTPPHPLNARAHQVQAQRHGPAARLPHAVRGHAHSGVQRGPHRAKHPA